MRNLKITSFLLALGLSLNLFAKEIPSNRPAVSAVENDVETVIANYLKALGGEGKIKAFKNAKMTAEANFQGQTIEIKTISDAENGRLMQSTSVGGNVMQKTILTNGKGQMNVMGQTQELPETAAGMLKSQTFLIPELYYKEIGFKSEYVGIEEVDGIQVHKLEVTSPEGIVIHEFYSVETGLKL